MRGDRDDWDHDPAVAPVHRPAPDWRGGWRPGDDGPPDRDRPDDYERPTRQEAT